MLDLTTNDALLEKLVELTGALKENIPIALDTLAAVLTPTGVIQAFAGSTVPDGWLLCDGSAVNRTDYADLYAVIGDTYGDGDGSTTFNLPDLVDKFIEGSATAGTVKAAGLPNIRGSFLMRKLSGGEASAIASTDANSAISIDASAGAGNPRINIGVGADLATNVVVFNAHTHNTIYDDDITTVQPPALTMQYIIKC